MNNPNTLQREVEAMIADCERLQPAQEPTEHEKAIFASMITRSEIEDALSILN